MTATHTHPSTDKQERNEWKVLLLLVLSFILMEALVRCYAGSISLDLRNTLSTHQTATRIASASDDTRTVLVVGNSLARCGVDLAILSQDSGWLQGADERDIKAELFAPDASSVVQWDWGIRRYFRNTGAHPDVILLFTARTNLLDSPTPPESLGAYYVASSDLSKAVESMQGSENAMRLLLGTVSNLLANRDRIRTRIGYSFLPGFETAWPKLTTVNEEERGSPEQQLQSGSTNSLERFIATASEMGAELHVFSVPMPEPYTLPESVLQLLEKSKIPHYNLSNLPGIDATRFPDGYHLDKFGARIFTEAILKVTDP